MATRCVATLIGKPAVIALNKSDRYIIFQDNDSNFALSSFDPSNIASPDKTISDVTLSNGLSFGPTTGYSSSKKLPDPFSAVTAAV